MAVKHTDLTNYLVPLVLLGILDIIAFFYDMKNQRSIWVSSLLSEEELLEIQTGKLTASWPAKGHAAPIVLAFFNVFGLAMVLLMNPEKALLNILWLAPLVFWIMLLRQSAIRPNGIIILATTNGIECRYNAGRNVVSRKMDWQSVRKIRQFFGGSVDGGWVLDGIRLSSCEDEIDLSKDDYNFAHFCALLLEMHQDQKMDDATRKFVIDTINSSSGTPPRLSFDKDNGQEPEFKTINTPNAPSEA